jgi:hypothetical protein
MECERNHTEFISFLQDELAISDEVIAVALRHRKQDVAPLHMVLWLYGLVSLEQLQKIFDWMECSNPIINAGF